MLALAIDTSGDYASLALATEKHLIEEVTFRHKMDLLRRLVPNIDRLLSDCGAKQADLDAIVISLGPGSFTGLRIGMAAAKGIAFVLGKPIVGISTFDVLAHGAAPAGPKSIATLIHARPNEAFWAIFRCENGIVERVSEDNVSTIDEIVSAARAESRIVFCGDGAERNRAAIEAGFGPESILGSPFSVARAGILAELGMARLMRGESDNVETIVPSYVRRPTPVIRLEQKEWR